MRIVILSMVLITASSCRNNDKIVGGEDLRFYARFMSEISNPDVSGYTSFELAISDDGSTHIEVKDQVSSVEAERYYQRNSVLEFGPNATIGFDLGKIDLLFDDLPEEKSNDLGYEYHELVLNRSGDLIGLTDDSLASPKLLALTENVSQQILGMLSSAGEALQDYGLWIDGDGVSPIQVPLEELFQDQERFNGKKLAVRGYLLVGSGEAFLFSEREIDWTREGENAGFIEIKGVAENRNMSSSSNGVLYEAACEGVFYRGFYDRDTQQAGRFERVKITLLEGEKG